MTNEKTNLTIETLAGGATLYATPSAANHVVGLYVIFPYPAATESYEETGLTGLALRLVRRGTLRYTAQEFDEALENLGAEIAVSSGDSSCSITVRCTSDSVNETLDLLHEMLTQPAYDAQELERERRATLASLRRADDNTMGWTLRRLNEALFPGHGLGRVRSGLLETVPTLTHEQTVARAQAVLRCENPYVVAVGNFPTNVLRDKFSDMFAAMKLNVPPPILLAADLPQPGERRVLERDVSQAVVALGWRVCSRLHPHYAALRMVSAVMGESMSSRFFLHLRDEQGLAYATGSRLSCDEVGGDFIGYIATNPKTREVAREGMLAQVERMKTELVSGEELERSRNWLLGAMVIQAQSNLARAGRLATYVGLGLGVDGEATYRQQLQAITPEMIRDAAREYLVNPVCVELIPTKEPK